MALDTEQIAQYRGSNLVGPDGNKIGSIEEIYLDDRTGQPEWALVKTGLFGMASNFVPLSDARPQGDALAVPYDKSRVKDAPRIEADEHLSEEQERELYRYYGKEYDAGYEAPSAHDQTRTPGTGRESVGRDVSGPTTDDAMTLSEERVDVGTQRQETGRVRLRKHVVSDEVTKRVPVSREEIRIEREPITDENRDQAYSGPELSEEEHEVTLTEERPVVEKKTVPTERVRVDKDTVSDEQTVSAEARREEAELDEEPRRR